MRDMNSLISESVKSCVALSYSVRIRKYKVKFEKKKWQGFILPERLRAK